jgi:intein/homing endonuclease
MAKARTTKTLDELAESLSAPPVEFLRTGVLPFDLITDGLGLPLGGSFIHAWGPNGTGKCVPGYARIETTKGYKQIEDLSSERVRGFTALEDVEVYTPTGIKKAESFYYEPDAKVNHLSLRDGSEVCGTDEHPILVVDSNGDVVMKKCKDIEVGEHVLRALNDAVEYPAHRYSLDEFYCLGLWLGDGTNDLSLFTRIGARYYHFTSCEEQLIDIYRRTLLPDGRGAIAKRKSKADDTRVFQRITFRAEYHIQNRPKIENILTETFPEIVGPATKFIPEYVFSASIAQRVAFLRGLIDTDGYLSKRGFCVSFMFKSKKMALGIQELLYSLGIYSTVSMNHRQWAAKADAGGVYYGVYAAPKSEEQLKGLFELYPNALKNLKYVSPRRTRCTLVPNDWMENFTRYIKSHVKAYKYGTKEYMQWAYACKVHGRLRKLLPKYRVLAKVTVDSLSKFWPEKSSLDGYQTVEVVAKSAVQEPVYDVSVPDGHLFYGQGGVVNHNSTMLLSVAKELAKAEKKTLFISIEASDKLLVDMGLVAEPYSKYIRQLSPVTYNEAQDVLASFFESDYTLAIVDSVSALSTTSLLSGSGDKSIEDHQVAPDAMPRLRLIKWVHATMRRSVGKAMVMLFHASANFDKGWYGDDYVPESGQKPQQFSVASILLEGGSAIYDAEDTKRVLGRDLIIRSPWKNRFSILGGSKRGIPIRVIFGKGVANNYTLMHYCVWKGYLKLGVWTTYNFRGAEGKIQGKVARLKWVNENYEALREDFYANAKEYVVALAGGFDAGDI